MAAKAVHPALDRLILGIEDRTRDFFIRKNSTDTSVVGQEFMDLAFDLRKLRRFEELCNLLAAGRAAGRRPLIIDGGANIGTTSVFFCVQCQDALVVAVEPDAANYQMLVMNTEGLPVLPLPCALAAEPGRCLLEDPGDGEWAYRPHTVELGCVEPVTVSAVTVDEILHAHAGDCFPFIVKIDIEGAERELFSHEAAWVDHVPLIIVEPHDWMLPRQRCAQPLLRRMARADRDFVIIGENIFSMSIDLPAARAHNGAAESETESDRSPLDGGSVAMVER